MDFENLKDLADKASDVIKQAESMDVKDKVEDVLEKVEGKEKAEDVGAKIEDAMDKAKSAIGGISALDGLMKKD